MQDALRSFPNPTSPTVLRALFRHYEFHPKRSRGQTFLVDANIADKIVETAQLTGREAVLEVGAGAGAVTRALVKAAVKVIAIEIEPKLVAILRETVGKTAEVMEADVLSVPWDPIFAAAPAGSWRVVANLPYAITGPAIIRLLEARNWVELFVIMVQTEVAERLVAPPGTRARGIISVLVQAYCEPKVMWRVPRTCFWPPPQVDSTILTLTVRRPAMAPASLADTFQEMVRAAFGTRRKTLLNALALSPGLGLSQPQVGSLLTEAGIEPSRRAETLSVEEFLRMTEGYICLQGSENL